MAYALPAAAPAVATPEPLRARYSEDLFGRAAWAEPDGVITVAVETGIVR